ncbi:ATP-dependent DNA ligase [Naasia lichenicola]|uniref:DNA ligase (ATP) n=1 Tax=Naasia lichenicola TaxID=2565933 RepID=A0A4S4FHI0_9MICO|nr:ATP-dependent DNA ligase [Naasia lichenicola]THG29740.1 ATP-dependent DNA ligase [Naasia lichenicola]
MTLPIAVPVDPMLAKAVPAVPDTGPKGAALSFEPKWDGFRAIVWIDRDPDGGLTVEIGSRGSKLLTRYFPELVEAFRAQFSSPAVIDGEIVVRRGEPGAERLDWEALSQRIHPAASRVTKLAEETPAAFIGFDLLAEGERSLLGEPFSVRRAELEKLLAAVEAPLHLSQVTTDPDLARSWLVEFEGAGLDGVVAKLVDEPYLPGKRSMLKIKHERTADAVVIAYRIHKSGTGVGSLLLGLYDADGELRGVGGSSAFSDARRLELIDELAPLVERDENGDPVMGEGDRNRFSSSKDTSFVKLRPERVMEVRYDQMEGSRFRHTAQFLRWRPDREPRSCTFEQLEVPAAYDLSDVLA